MIAPSKFKVGDRVFSSADISRTIGVVRNILTGIDNRYICQINYGSHRTAGYWYEHTIQLAEQPDTIFKDLINA